jgi:putative ABC transport system permease protein
MKPAATIAFITRRLGGAVLWLYPTDFRRRHREQLLIALDDGIRRAAREAGPAAAASRAVADLLDLAFGALAMRLQRRPARRRGAAPDPATTPRRRTGSTGVRASTPPATYPGAARSRAAGPSARPPEVLEIMSDIFGDLRLAARSLRRQPLFTLVAVLTLAVAIGANVAIFSVVKRVILDPLPYPDAGGLIAVSSEHEESGSTQVSTADLLDWREAARTVEGLAAYMYWSYTYTGGDEPLDVPGMRVSTDLFDLLRATPQRGRLFHEAEGRAGSEPVALLSDRFWRDQLGADEAVIGSRLVLDGAPHTVVGVMRPGFEFPPQTDNGFWTAMAWDADERHAGRGQRNNLVIGRLAPGATLEQAGAELAAIAADLGDRYPETNGRFGVSVTSAHEALVVGPTGSNAIFMLFAGVGFLLLIACTNVTNLMLARLQARDPEMSLRAALGAGRAQLVRPFMSETLLVAAAGGGLGTLLAWWGIARFRSMPDLPLERLRELQLDPGVAMFALVLTLGVGIAFGLLPTRRAGGWAAAGGMRRSHAVAGGRRENRLLSGLVIAEVALSVVLLIGAGLLARTFAELIAVDVGFRRDGLLAANVYIPDTLYPEDHQQVAFFEEVLERVAAIPGVRSAGAVSSLPLDYAGIDFALPYRVVGQPVPREGPPRAQYRVASAGYVETMALPLLRGRTFSDADRADAPPVMLINETLARHAFDEDDPVGEKLSIAIGGEHEIVGVVRDVRHYGLDVDPVAEMYVPLAQDPFGGMVIVLRGEGDAAAFVQPVKEAIYAVDARQPVYAFHTMDALVAANVAFARLNMLLSLLFAGIALLLAALGIYGVMAYAVTRRTREIGVRMALGATAADARRVVVGGGMKMALAGMALGIVAAAALTRLVRSQLYGVDAFDLTVFGGISLLFGAIALLSSYLPARRATRVDPLVALRRDTP